MMDLLHNRTAGVALIVGYALLIAILFRNPSEALATATATAGNTVLFVGVPVLGLLSGVYVLLDGPFGVVGVSLTAVYLAAAGVAMSLFPTGPSAVLTLAGLCLFALAALALVSSLRDAVSTIGIVRDTT